VFGLLEICYRKHVTCDKHKPLQKAENNNNVEEVNKNTEKALSDNQKKISQESDTKEGDYTGEEDTRETHRSRKHKKYT